MKIIKIGDVFLIAFVLLIAVILLIFNGQKGEKAIVEVNGETIKTFDLSVDSEFIYEGKYTNMIVVKNSEIYVAESDCPNKSCVHSGKTKTGAKVICCLPNKLIIRVIDSDKKVDVISGWPKK